MKYLLIVCLLFASSANATIYFSFDGESGYQYMGAGNAHPGGGYFSHMGGSVSKPEGIYDAGTCSADTANFHFTTLSSDAAGQGASIGSTSSIKTPYLGVCPNQSFLRDTTVIRTPYLQEYYLRWKQKWTGSFQASVQQKFLKAYDSEDTQEKTMSAYMPTYGNAGVTSGNFYAYFNNIDGVFNGACTLSTAQIKISPMGTCSPPNWSVDTSSLTTSQIIFEIDRWYDIEIHSKMNSANDVADAIFEVWIDGVLRMQITNFKMKDGATYNSQGTNQFEFQHVYYDRSSIDQTTYMDDIIISSEHIDIDLPITTASPASGRYSAKQSVTLTANESATIYYTTDGSTPTESSTQYSAAVTVFPGTTLRYFAKDTAGNSEAVKTATYGWGRTCR